MARRDYVLNGDAESAKALVVRTVENLGYRVNDKGNGKFVLERGSKGKSLFLGALSGNDFFMQFALSFFADQQDNSLVARLESNGMGGAAFGGVVGASKSKDAYQQLTQALDHDLQSSGTLKTIHGA